MPNETVNETTPDFLRDVDDEERAALAAVGVELTTNERDKALVTNEPTVGAVMAAASYYLRDLAKLARDDAAITERLGAEIAMVESCYLPQRQRIAARRERVTERLETLRQLAALGGAFEDRQSHDLGFGVFGQRQKAEHIRVLDKAAALAWAKDHAAELVQRVVTEVVAQPKLAAHYKATGELPDGCAYEPPTVELVAKPRADGAA